MVLGKMWACEPVLDRGTYGGKSDEKFLRELGLQMDKAESETRYYLCNKAFTRFFYVYNKNT